MNILRLINEFRLYRAAKNVVKIREKAAKMAKYKEQRRIDFLKMIVTFGTVRDIDMLDKTLEQYAPLNNKLQKELLNSPVEYGGGDNIIAGLMGSNCGIEYLSALIRYGADINHKNEYGRTALHKAAQDKNENNVRVLIELGADKSIIDYQKSTPKDYWPEMFIKLESEELLNSLHGEITGGMGKRRM